MAVNKPTELMQALLAEQELAERFAAAVQAELEQLSRARIDPSANELAQHKLALAQQWQQLLEQRLQHFPDSSSFERLSQAYPDQVALHQTFERLVSRARHIHSLLKAGEHQLEQRLRDTQNLLGALSGGLSEAYGADGLPQHHIEPKNRGWA